MSKSKWYNWLLNPIGAAVRNITDGKGATGQQINAVFNPLNGIKNGIDDIIDRKKRDSSKKSEIEEEAMKLGMSLDEYLKAYPDKASQYQRVSNTIIDDILENPHVDAYIKNLTGEKDVSENEKNRLFQSEEAEKNRVWEEEQAQAAREWDSIGAQMERAASAGVNPISIAMQNGGIGSSATTSIPSAPSTPSGSASIANSGFPDIFSTIMQGIGVTAEMRLKQSQSDDIVAMRQYNIAEKIANTDHLRSLCEGQGLSNVAQEIQNRWLDVFNQATYDGMLLDNGVKRETILKERSVTRLNMQQIASIQQNMEMDLKAFNAKLPLELQLMESDINLKNMSAKELYEEICIRHLQAIEQKSRNLQAASEAESAEVTANIAKQTMEDAISDFHNSMVHHAAEAGIRLNDYMYYGASPISASQMPSVLMNLFNKGVSVKQYESLTDPNLKGLNYGNPSVRH